MPQIVVHIETTNPDAYAQLRERMEARPLDRDDTGHLHPLTILIETDGRPPFASVYDPESAGCWDDQDDND